MTPERLAEIRTKCAAGEYGPHAGQDVAELLAEAERLEAVLVAEYRQRLGAEAKLTECREVQRLLYVENADLRALVAAIDRATYDAAAGYYDARGQWQHGCRPAKEGIPR